MVFEAVEGGLETLQCFVNEEDASVKKNRPCSLS